MKNIAEAYQRMIGKSFVFEIGQKGKKRILVITPSESDFYHLSGFHHLNQISIKPKTFYKNCLLGKYVLEDLLNQFPDAGTGYFSERTYHQLRVESILKIVELFETPNEFILKKVPKRYYSAGTNDKFSYCFERLMESSNGTEYKLILFFVFDIEIEGKEYLKMQSIGIKQPNFTLSNLSKWKVLSCTSVNNLNDQK